MLTIKHNSIRSSTPLFESKRIYSNVLKTHKRLIEVSFGPYKKMKNSKMIEDKIFVDNKFQDHGKCVSSRQFNNQIENSEIKFLPPIRSEELIKKMNRDLSRLVPITKIDDNIISRTKPLVDLTYSIIYNSKLTENRKDLSRYSKKSKPKFYIKPKISKTIKITKDISTISGDITGWETDSSFI